jgi:large subunit ribosomal protein L10
LGGQLAVVTGQRDISVSAKALKTFFSEFARPKIKFGYLNNKRLEALDILTLADLPSLEVLRGRLLAVLQAPATRLAQILNTPAIHLARVLRAKADKS